MNRLGRERDPVVRPDGERQAVLAERALEDGPSGDGLRREQPTAGEQEPGVLVRDGERVAVRAVARAELPLEVRRPEVVGGGRGGPDDARVDLQEILRLAVCPWSVMSQNL